MRTSALKYQITAPEFSAGFILSDGVVVASQRTLKYMAGWSLWQVIKYCDFRGWILEQEEWQRPFNPALTVPPIWKARRFGNGDYP